MSSLTHTLKFWKTWYGISACAGCVAIILSLGILFFSHTSNDFVLFFAIMSITLGIIGGILCATTHFHILRAQERAHNLYNET